MIFNRYIIDFVLFDEYPYYEEEDIEDICKEFNIEVTDNAEELINKELDKYFYVNNKIVEFDLYKGYAIIDLCFKYNDKLYIGSYTEDENGIYDCEDTAYPAKEIPSVEYVRV